MGKITSKVAGQDASENDINFATEDKQDDIITALGTSSYPIGSGVNGTVTLTSASTAYSVPASASTKKHVLSIHNGSDTDVYLGYATLTSGGILLPAGGTATFDLGASQVIYAYCTSAGKVLNFSYKEVD